MNNPTEDGIKSMVNKYFVECLECPEWSVAVLSFHVF